MGRVHKNPPFPQLEGESDAKYRRRLKYAYDTAGRVVIKKVRDPDHTKRLPPPHRRKLEIEVPVDPQRAEELIRAAREELAARSTETRDPRKTGILVRTRERVLAHRGGGKYVMVHPKGVKVGEQLCGAATRAGTRCLRPAGWGTSHRGLGRCKRHEGRNQLALQSSNRELNQMLGQEFEIDPINALLWCIRLTAGDVRFWQKELTRLQNEAIDNGLNPVDVLTEETIMGKQIIIAGRKYEEAQQRLAKFSQQALTTGLAERIVRMAEAYSEFLATLLQRFVDDVLNTPQMPPWLRPHIEDHLRVMIPKRLIELEQRNNHGEGNFMMPTPEEANSIIEGTAYLSGLDR